MERRHHSRKNISVRVYASVPGQPTMTLKASNLSTGGVFLETNPLEFPIEGPVQLVFALTRKNSSVVRLHRMNAVTTHLTFEGVGMKFSSKKSTARRDQKAPVQAIR